MNSKYPIITFLLAMLLIALVVLNYRFLDDTNAGTVSSDFFIGIDVAYDNAEEIKQLINDTSAFTNFFVIGSTGITYDLTKLNNVSQYLYDKGMYFMIYFEHQRPDKRAIQLQWVAEAKLKWGQYFLGLYAYDEPGGRQLDDAWPKVVPDEDWFADNFTDAANKYVSRLNSTIYRTIRNQTIGLDLSLFTSDYALYWFDYKAGYDVVFSQFGWNYSRNLNVALIRGAAKVQNKEWGVMITWTYTQPPYIESGTELYNDLVLAYENGAKYVLVFDTNENYTQGILKEEHLDAMKRFWQYTKDNPRKSNTISGRVAYVLPKDYAYGFRGPEDKIWGLWNADDFSLEISTKLGSLLGKYGEALDIIYDDGLEANKSYGYSKFIFWNGTVWTP